MNMKTRFMAVAQAALQTTTATAVIVALNEGANSSALAEIFNLALVVEFVSYLDEEDVPWDRSLTRASFEVLDYLTSKTEAEWITKAKERNETLRSDMFTVSQRLVD